MFDDVARRLDGLAALCNAVLPGPMKVGFLTLYLYTGVGLDAVDELAGSPRWDSWHDFGVGLLLTVQTLGLATVAAAAWLAITRPQRTPLHDPANVVAVPGVNDYMPLAAAPYVVVALLTATLVHEVGHAVACRREGVEIEEWGVALLFGVLPLAAYVLPSVDLDTASSRAKVRIFSAGVCNNLVVTVAALALLVSPLTASPESAYLTYFGWALTGGVPPTADTISALGALTNLCFWTAMLHANVGVLNALPVTIFDGGRVVELLLRDAETRTGLDALSRWNGWVLQLASATVVALVGVAVLGSTLR